MNEKANSGLNTERLNRLSCALHNDVNDKKYDGCVILVARNGDIGLQEAIGVSDRKTNRPCKLDNIFFMMSITKVFTNVILLSQIERGDIALITRISDIIPEFKGGYKEQVTIYHMLTHTAGAPHEGLPEPEFFSNSKAAVEAACRADLTSVPGEKFNYTTFWAHTILGEIIYRVDGGKRRLRDIFQDELFGPLKMNDTALGVRRDLMPRVVPLVYLGPPMPGPAPDFNNLINEDSEVPAWGAISTIGDLFRFSEMMRRGGELDGVRILSPATIQLATTIHTDTKTDEGLSQLFVGSGWPTMFANTGLDFVIRGDSLDYPFPMGSFTSPRTYGKFGGGSTGFWVDPDRGVTFIFLSVGTLHEYDNFFRFQRLSDMAMSAVI